MPRKKWLVRYVGWFAMHLRYIYSRVNYINKLDFLHIFYAAYIEAITLANI